MANVLIKEYKNEIISGKFLNLRIANEEDAEFILSLRLDPLLNQFIGKTDPSVEKQKEWLKKKYNNENDFMYLIEDKNSNKLGTIALYDIDLTEKRAEWGRLIVKPNTIFFIPIEATIQLLNFAFNKMQLTELYGGANNLNKSIINFHIGYANVSAVDEIHTWFTFDQKSLKKIKNKYKNFHNI